jgi:ABC-2 type transport system ATP-binding protein
VEGTADGLKSAVGGERIELTLAPEASIDAARHVLSEFAIGDVHVDDRSLTAPIIGGARTLTDALRALDHTGVVLRDVGLRRPSLDDVFLALTGEIAGGTEIPDTPTGAPLEEVA